MGDLSTKFEEQKRNLSELKQMHEPDAATQRHDYIEFRKKQRKALRTLNNFKTVLRDGRYRLEQVKNGYIKAGAENVYNSKKIFLKEREKCLRISEYQRILHRIS